MALPALRYLDRPIFGPERQAAEAWGRGGDEEEQRVRAACLARQQAEHANGLRAYRAWAARVRAERQAGSAIPTTEKAAEAGGEGGEGEEEDDDAAAAAAAAAERALVVDDPDGVRKLGEAFWKGEEKKAEAGAGAGAGSDGIMQGEEEEEEEEDVPPLYDAAGLGKELLLLSAMEEVD